MTPATFRALAVVAALALLAFLAFAVPSCVQRYRSQGAQSRVDASQAKAASGSAKDAIEATAAASGRETASEQLTRDNERAIRAAPGADAPAGAAVNRAGRSAACQRAAYRSDPACKETPR